MSPVTNDDRRAVIRVVMRRREAQGDEAGAKRMEAALRMMPTTEMRAKFRINHS